MKRKFRGGISKCLSLSCLTLLTAASALAGSKHPATVPANYVITPFGYFHPSCVNHLAKGDVLQRDEKAIQHANGTSDQIPVCSYPHYRADGEKVTGDEREFHPPDISHAWVEYASVTTTSAYGQVYAEWNVPPAPKTNDGQTLFFFNGLEDINDSVTIIQPVLGWNADYASAWGIASWNCCVNGQVNEAPPAPVNSGDLIVGNVYSTCASGKETCDSWDIVTFDFTNGNYSELLGTSNYGQTFNWAFGGVLEVWNLVQCGDYPGGGWSVDFFEQYLSNDKFVQIAKPAWKITNGSSGLTPQCNYNGTTPEEVILDN